MRAFADLIGRLLDVAKRLRRAARARRRKRVLDNPTSNWPDFSG
jgi:hypothetical protein